MTRREPKIIDLGPEVGIVSISIKAWPQYYGCDSLRGLVINMDAESVKTLKSLVDEADRMLLAHAEAHHEYRSVEPCDQVLLPGADIPEEGVGDASRT